MKDKKETKRIQESVWAEVGEKLLKSQERKWEREKKKTEEKKK